MLVTGPDSRLSLFLCLTMSCTGACADDSEASEQGPSSETSSASGDGDGDGDDTSGDGDGDDDSGDGDGDGDDPAGDGDGEVPDDEWGGDPEEPGPDGPVVDLELPDDPTLGCTPGQEQPYAGPLCGPAQLPCALEADLELDPLVGHRNGSPTIALSEGCEPHVLFAVAVGGYHGFYARHEDGAWLREALPMPLARGALVVDPATRVPTLMASGEELEVSAWTRDPSWELAASLVGPYSFGEGLTRAPDGTLHMIFMTDDADLRRGVALGGEWSSTPIPSLGASPYGTPEVTVDHTGTPHYSAWVSASGHWELRWQMPGRSSELVHATANTDAVGHGHALVTTGDGPHMLVQLQGPESHDQHRLAYATRTGPNAWSMTEFVEDSDTTLCSGYASGPDEVCAYDYVRHALIDIVASANGELRLLWSRLHYTGTMIANCEGDAPQGQCNWELSVDTSTGELWVGWPEQGQITGVPLAASFGSAADAAIDSSGRVHIALYEERFAGIGLRYLRFGP